MIHIIKSGKVLLFAEGLVILTPKAVINPVGVKNHRQGQEKRPSVRKGAFCLSLTAVIALLGYLRKRPLRRKVTPFNRCHLSRSLQTADRLK